MCCDCRVQERERIVKALRPGGERRVELEVELLLQLGCPAESMRSVTDWTYQHSHNSQSAGAQAAAEASAAAAAAGTGQGHLWPPQSALRSGSPYRPARRCWR